MFRQSFVLCALLLLLLSPLAQCAAPRSSFYPSARHELAYWEHSSDQNAADIRDQINQGHDNLATEIAAAQEDGLSLDPARLQTPLPPDDQNAAPLYVQLAQLLKDKPLHLPAYGDGMSTRHFYTKDQIAAVQTIYDSRQDVWNLVHEAAAKPQCVFARDWSRGPSLTFPEFPTVRAAARLLETESYLFAHQGKYDDAIHAAKRGLWVARHAGSDPSLISYLVGCACEAIALQSFSDILALAGSKGDVCTGVSNAIALNRPMLSPRRGLIGDLVEFSGHLDQARQLLADDKAFPKLAKKYAVLVVSAQDLPAFSVADRRFLHLLWNAQEAEYIHDLRTLIDNADQPIAVRNSVFNQPQITLADTVNDPVKFISNLLLPMVAKCPLNGERVHTQEDVLISAASALSVKALAAEFPATQTLTTLDAFNAVPLLYRREGNGFVIFSQGPDGTFDGSQPGRPRQPTQAYFRYPVESTPVPPEMLK